MSEQFTIRPLIKNDWQAYRDIRLEALRLHGKNFGSNFAEEMTFPDKEWIDRIADDKGRIFGLFDQDRIVGTSVVYTYRDDPSGKTALMAGWYMRDPYQGKGLFSKLVNASMQWVEQQPRFEKIRVHHRGGNEASRANILKAGFTHIGTEDWIWPDGVNADFCMYERVLKDEHY